MKSYNNVSPDRFVEYWLKPLSAKQIAEALGMKVKAVYDRARYYRTHGVELPVKRVSGVLAKLDVKKLNGMIRKAGY